MTGIYRSCGPGFTGSTGTVSYEPYDDATIFGENPSHGMHIHYPGDIRNHPYRNIMMKI
jgi:hypothetical protein